FYLRAFIQCARRYDDVFTAFDVPRQRGAAIFAKAGREIFGFGQFKSTYPLFSAEPAESIRRNEDIGCMCRAGKFSAALAVTVLKDFEWRIDLVSYAAT